MRAPKRVPDRNMMLSEFPTGGLVVEVGTLKGTYAKAMWRRLKPDRMILIDLWQDYPSPVGTPDHIGKDMYQKCREFAAGKNVELWRGLSVNQIPKLPDRQVRVAYLDASHVYKDVLSDLEQMLPKMESGGWLAGHDYCSLNLFGVVRATAVFCERHNLSIDILTTEPPEVVNHLQPNIKEVNLFSFAIQIP